MVKLRVDSKNRGHEVQKSWLHPLSGCFWLFLAPLAESPKNLFQVSGMTNEMPKPSSTSSEKIIIDIITVPYSCLRNF